MKLVVDTNVLFSFFWKFSLTRKLLVNSNIEFISPEIAIKELERYSKEIIKKTKVKECEFQSEFNSLKSVVKFVRKMEYSSFIKETEKFAPDKADAHFLALCMKFSCFLWSNDVILKHQNKIKVLSTKDLIDLIL